MQCPGGCALDDGIRSLWQRHCEPKTWLLTSIDTLVCIITDLIPCICFSVIEFMDFTSKIVTERTAISQRASVKEQGMYCVVLGFLVKKSV